MICFVFARESGAGCRGGGARERCIHTYSARNVAGDPEICPRQSLQHVHSAYVASVLRVGAHRKCISKDDVKTWNGKRCAHPELEVAEGPRRLSSSSGQAYIVRIYIRCLFPVRNAEVGSPIGQMLSVVATYALATVGDSDHDARSHRKNH